jgi:hypothetical protein
MQNHHAAQRYLPVQELAWLNIQHRYGTHVCRVPLAPPHTLILEDNLFMDFPVQPNNKAGEHIALSGAQLSLRHLGKAAQKEFKATVLAEHAEALLQHKSWEEWSLQLEHAVVDHEAYQAWQAKHSQWVAEVAARRHKAKERAEGPIPNKEQQKQVTRGDDTVAQLCMVKATAVQGESPSG